MKITRKDQANHVVRPDGVDILYYLFDEYEVHYDILPPGCHPEMHRHEKVLEAILILEGELTIEWKEGDEVKSDILRSGDMREGGTEMHTIFNNTDQPVRMITVKIIPEGKNKHEIFLNDKIVEE